MFKYLKHIVYVTQLNKLIDCSIWENSSHFTHNFVNYFKSMF